MQQADIELAHGIPGDEVRPDVEAVPLAVQVHAEFTPPLRSNRAVRHFDLEALFHRVQKRFFRQAVHVTHDTVIVEDLHLVVGKHDDLEIVVTLFTRVPGIGFPAHGGDAAGGGGTVVAVGNVELIHGIKAAGEQLDVGIVVDHPQGMAHAVIGGEIVLRRRIEIFLHHFVHHRVLPVGEKDRAGLCIEGIDLAYAVVFLIRARELVATNTVAIVLRHGGHRHQAHLGAAVHDQPVEIIDRFLVPPEHPLVDEALKILGAPGIDRLVIRIGARRQVDLRLGDVQKTPRTPLGTRAGLLGVEHIIGRRDHILGILFLGPQAGKRSDQGHNYLAKWRKCGRSAAF